MIHLSVIYKKSNVYKRLNPFEQSEHRDNEITSTTNPPLLHAMFLITNAENFITANSIMETFLSKYILNWNFIKIGNYQLPLNSSSHTNETKTRVSIINDKMLAKYLITNHVGRADTLILSVRWVMPVHNPHEISISICTLGCPNSLLQATENSQIFPESDKYVDNYHLEKQGSDMF